MKFTHKLGLVILVASLAAPTKTKADAWDDVATGAVIGGLVTAIGCGLYWLFSESDAKKIENIEKQTRSADRVLRQFDSIVDGVLDVYSNVQDEVHNLYAVAVRAMDAGYKMTNIKTDINRCLSAAVSARNGAQKVIDKIRGKNSYDLSHEDRQLRDRAQRAIYGLDDRIKELRVCKRFFDNFGDYFDIFEQKKKILDNYQQELQAYAYWYETNYYKDVRMLTDQLKPYAVRNGGTYPFINYGCNLAIAVKELQKLERKAAHKYLGLCAELTGLVQNFTLMCDAIKASDSYQHDIARREHDRREQERMRLERQRIDAMHRQARAQEAQAREMHRRNNLQRRCRVCRYDYTCATCDWLKWCSSCDYKRSCIHCNLHEPTELSLKFTVNL